MFRERRFRDGSRAGEGELPKVRVDLGGLRRLLSFAAPYWRVLLVAGVCLVINTLLGLALPYALQQLVDGALVNRNLAFLNWVAVALVGVSLLRTLFGFGQGYLLSWVGERVVANLRRQLYTHLQSLGLRFFADHRTGELTSRLSNDTSTIQIAVTDNMVNLLSQAITLVGGVVIIVAINWRLTLLMLAIVPAVVLVVLYLGRRIRTISRAVQDAVAEATAAAEEGIAGVRIVKSFAREAYESERYGEAVERSFQAAMRRTRVRALLGPLIGALSFLAIGVVLWVGAQQVISGQLTAGQLIAFLLYTVTIAQPIAAFSGIYSQLQEALGASERVFELLGTQSDVAEQADASDMPPIVGRVTFEDVHFSYDGHIQALTGIFVDARPGQVVAIVGPSGAGKSTFINLIPRFYDPASGAIRIDGIDVRSVKLESLRRQIGMVPQETALFSGTIHDNIVYGRLGASAEEVRVAAIAANAHNFITDLALGYDSIVGERGVKLSGGQRQRVAIARALLKDPRILILDEATSSLDSESEQAVQDALERLMRNRTTFVIAHRLSTVINADWILVLDKGKLVEQGTHRQLLLRPQGLYHRLYELQFREPGIDDEGRETKDEGSLQGAPFVVRPLS